MARSLSKVAVSVAAASLVAGCGTGPGRVSAPAPSSASREPTTIERTTTPSIDTSRQSVESESTAGTAGTDPATTTASTAADAALPVGEPVDLPDFADRPTLLQRVADPTAPLVVVFHGSRGSIENVQKRSELHLLGPAAGVAVLWLSGKPLPKRSWNTNNRCCDPASTNHVDDMAYLDAALAAVRALGLSPVRIISAGVSNGAGMAVSVGCKRSHVFSAAVSVAGWMPVSCRNTTLSLVAIGGTKDDIVGRRKPRQMVTTWRRSVVHCPSDPDEETNGPAHITTWRGCTGNTFVRLVVLDDIEHLWPRFDYYDATLDIIKVAKGEI
jgi:poly(3-hydroxybutyrate) depolymerase